eukprot:g1241.t1
MISLLPCFPKRTRGAGYARSKYEGELESYKQRLPASFLSTLEKLEEIKEPDERWACDRRHRFETSFLHSLPEGEVLDDAALTPFTELIEGLLEVDVFKSNQAWLGKWHQLRWHRHADLNAANILVDIRETSWLIDFATAGVGDVWSDSAKLIASMLLQYQFCTGARACTEADVGKRIIFSRKDEGFERVGTVTVGGERRSVEWGPRDCPPAEFDGVILKVDDPAEEGSIQVSVKGGGAAPIVDLVNPTLADSSKERAECARAVIDAFVPMREHDARGEHEVLAELWESDKRRQRAEALPDNMGERISHVLDAANSVIESQCRLVQAGEDSEDADLHPLGFYLALLQEALKTLCYVDNKPWQKQVAWYLARRLALSLIKELKRAPVQAPALSDPVKVPLLLEPSPVRLLWRRNAGSGMKVMFVTAPEDDRASMRAIDGSDEWQQIFFDNLCHDIVDGSGDGDALQDMVVLLETAMTSLVILHEKFPVKKGGKRSETSVGKLNTLGLQPPSFSASVANQASAVNHGNGEVTFGLLTHWANVWAEQVVRTNPSISMRNYRAGQQLVVLHGNTWVDVVVRSCKQDGLHMVQLDNSGVDEFAIQLHAHNHAPRHMYAREFDEQFDKYHNALSTLHATIPDALSGRRLDVFAQCVPIKIVVGSGSDGADDMFQSIREVYGVSDYIHAMVNKRRQGEAARTNILVVAGPAAGKTCMASQITMEAFRRTEEGRSRLPTRWKAVGQAPPEGSAAGNELTSAALAKALTEKTVFARDEIKAFNVRARPGDYIRADDGEYYQPVTGPGLIPILIKVMDLQRKLAMEEHKSVFASKWNWIDAYLQLLYGAGSLRYLFLRQALMARRALVVLDGIDEGGSNKDKIQRHVANVLGAQGHPLLVTSRPAGLDEHMYTRFNKLKMEALTDAQQEMIVRARLRAVNAEAHVESLISYIGDMPTDAETNERITGNPLMLTMVTCIYEQQRSVEAMPERVVELYRMASDIMLSHVERKHRARGGSPQHLKPLLMRIALATHSALKRQVVGSDVQSMIDAVDDHELQRKLQQTWKGVRRQLVEGRFPLLSMLQREPLEFQFSHLSFQEYFTVCAICEGMPLGPEVVPWRWLPWWRNVLRFGTELEERFAPGLLKAAGVTEQTDLDLSGKLVPDLSVVTDVLIMLIKHCELHELDIRDTNMTLDAGRRIAEFVADHRTLRVVSEIPIMALKDGTLESLDCKGRNYGPLQAHLLLQALSARKCTLKALSLWSNPLASSEKCVAELLGTNTSLRSLSLRETEIEGTHVFEALESQTTLQALDASWNPEVATHSHALSAMLRSNSALTDLQLVGCGLGDKVAEAITHALKRDGCRIRRLQLEQNKLADSAAEIGDALTSNVSLEFLGLSSNGLTDVAGQRIGAGLRTNTALRVLDLSKNLLTATSAGGIAEGLSARGAEGALGDLRLSGNTLSGANEPKKKELAGAAGGEPGADEEEGGEAETSDDIRREQFATPEAYQRALARRAEENPPTAKAAELDSSGGSKVAVLLSATVLRQLDLSACGLGRLPACGTELASALAKNTTLSTLVLGHNGFDAESTAAIHRIGEQRDTLTVMLPGNDDSLVQDRDDEVVGINSTPAATEEPGDEGGGVGAHFVLYNPDILIMAFAWLGAGGLCAAMTTCAEWRGTPEKMVYDDLVLDNGQRNGVQRYQYATMCAKYSGTPDVNNFSTRAAFSKETDRFVQFEVHCLYFRDEQFVGFCTPEELVRNGCNYHWIYCNGRDGPRILKHKQDDIPQECRAAADACPKYFNGARIGVRIDFDADSCSWFLDGDEVFTLPFLPPGPLYPVSGPDYAGDVTHMKPFTSSTTDWLNGAMENAVPLVPRRGRVKMGQYTDWRDEPLNLHPSPSEELDDVPQATAWMAAAKNEAQGSRGSWGACKLAMIWLVPPSMKENNASADTPTGVLWRKLNKVAGANLRTVGVEGGVFAHTADPSAFEAAAARAGFPLNEGEPLEPPCALVIKPHDERKVLLRAPELLQLDDPDAVERALSEIVLEHREPRPSFLLEDASTARAWVEQRAGRDDIDAGRSEYIALVALLADDDQIQAWSEQADREHRYHGPRGRNRWPIVYAHTCDPHVFRAAFEPLQVKALAAGVPPPADDVAAPCVFLMKTFDKRVALLPNNELPPGPPEAIITSVRGFLRQEWDPTPSQELSSSLAMRLWTRAENVAEQPQNDMNSVYILAFLDAEDEEGLATFARLATDATSVANWNMKPFCPIDSEQMLRNWVGERVASHAVSVIAAFGDDEPLLAALTNFAEGAEIAGRNRRGDLKLAHVPDSALLKLAAELAGAPLSEEAASELCAPCVLVLMEFDEKYAVLSAAEIRALLAAEPVAGAGGAEAGVDGPSGGQPALVARLASFVNANSRPKPSCPLTNDGIAASWAAECVADGTPAVVALFPEDFPQAKLDMYMQVVAATGGNRRTRLKAAHTRHGAPFKVAAAQAPTALAKAELAELLGGGGDAPVAAPCMFLLTPFDENFAFLPASELAALEGAEFQARCQSFVDDNKQRKPSFHLKSVEKAESWVEQHKAKGSVVIAVLLPSGGGEAGGGADTQQAAALSNFKSFGTAGSTDGGDGHAARMMDRAFLAHTADAAVFMAVAGVDSTAFKAAEGAAVLRNWQLADEGTAAPVLRARGLATPPQWQDWFMEHVLPPPLRDVGVSELGVSVTPLSEPGKTIGPSNNTHNIITVHQGVLIAAVQFGDGGDNDQFLGVLKEPAPSDASYSHLNRGATIRHASAPMVRRRPLNKLGKTMFVKGQVVTMFVDVMRSTVAFWTNGDHVAFHTGFLPK